MKISKNNFTADSVSLYRKTSAEIDEEFKKLIYEAEKNYKNVTNDLYRAKVKALRQAEMLLVPVGGQNEGIKESNGQSD